MNKVVLIGRLGADPEYRYLENGTPVTTFRLATSERWKDGQGERQERTEWHSIVAWRGLAEICGKYLVKGSLISCVGKLQTRSWEADGITRYKTEVVIDEMEMLDSRKDGDASKPADDMDWTPPVREPSNVKRKVVLDEEDDSIPF